MEKLQITVHDAKIKNMVIRILHSIDGVEINEVRRGYKEEPAAALQSLTGIWKNRNISLDDLRDKAWKRNNS